MWSALKALAEFHPVRPASSECTCTSLRHDKTLPIVQPDGAFVLCLSCGARWIEWPLRETTDGRTAGSRPTPIGLRDELVRLATAI